MDIKKNNHRSLALPEDNLRQACRFLNTLISKEDCGRLKFDAASGKLKPKHINTMEEIAAHQHCGAYWLRAITHKNYADHWTQAADGKWKETYYFTADEHRHRSLLNIDIDCHHRGSLAGAIAFAEWLKANVFPNLYFEVSTNGNGVHGYILLAKSGQTAQEICDWADSLQKNLQRHQHKFDIEMVEVKGQPRWFEREGRRIKRVHSGQLAKVPREIVQRLDEFKATTEVDFEDWVFPELPDAKEPKKTIGSTSGRHVQDWQKYAEVAKRIMRGQDRIRVDEDVAVTTEDLAILISILHFCSKNMNKDGTMPYERIKGLWDALVKAGDTSRNFNAKRYVFARGLLDQCEYMIDWTSSSYIPKGGEGTACKWKLTQRFVAILDEMVNGMLDEIAQQITHTPLSEGSLDSVLGWKPESEIIFPEPIWPSLMMKLDVDEVEKYLVSWGERETLPRAA